jgi:hypothetical protein
MAKVTAIGFLVPLLDPCNAGANAAGGRRVMKSATWLLWGLMLQELQKARVMVLVEHPYWNRVQRVQWRASVGSKVSEH